MADVAPEVTAALANFQVVALTIWGEARGASPALRAAIASVIVNRVKQQRKAFGLTPREVCLKPWQFSCWKAEGGKANHDAVMAAASVLLAGDGGLSRTMHECVALALEVTKGILADTVQGATFYYSPAAMVPKGRMPAWAVGLTPVAEIDGTRFYKA